MNSLFNCIQNWRKTLLACLCILFVIELALVGTGTALIAKQSPLIEYNKAAAGFRPKRINSWSGTINGEPISVFREALRVPNAEKATSVYAQVILPALDEHNTSDYPISVNIKGIQPFVRSISPIKTRETVHQCLSSSASCEPEHVAFKSKCRELNGLFALTSCPPAFDVCASCTLHAHLTAAYLVVERKAGGGGRGAYVESETLRSALYGFGDDTHLYTTPKPDSVEVFVYSSKDPLIALERLTKGKRVFATDLRTTGMTLLLTGMSLMFVEVCLCAAATLWIYCAVNPKSSIPSEKSEENKFQFSPMSPKSSMRLSTSDPFGIEGNLIEVEEKSPRSLSL